MSKEFKGTKGDFKDGTKGWKAVPYGEDDKVGFATHEIHWSDYGECVAEVVHEEANAKLIAAALDLLEALQELKLALEGEYHDWSHISKAETAISKALD